MLNRGFAVQFESDQAMELSQSTLRRLALLGLIVCIVALGAELTVQLARGDCVLSALLRFLSYYTVVTNILLALIYTAHLKPSRTLQVFRGARVRTMAAAMIALVMLVYALILARTENPHGLERVSVIAAHYITPPIYLLWWAATSGRDRLDLRDVPAMLAPSIAYMAFMLIHGYVRAQTATRQSLARRLPAPAADSQATRVDEPHCSGVANSRSRCGAPSANRRSPRPAARRTTAPTVATTMDGRLKSSS